MNADEARFTLLDIATNPNLDAAAKGVLYALLAAEVNTAAPAHVPAPAAAPSGQWAEMSAHVYQARMVRRETTPLGGLTSKERKALAAANRDALEGALALSREAYTTLWTSLVAAHKAA